MLGIKNGIAAGLTQQPRYILGPYWSATPITWDNATATWAASLTGGGPQWTATTATWDATTPTWDAERVSA
jgi:hypothetical protein